jgi:hypothetical protein
MAISLTRKATEDIASKEIIPTMLAKPLNPSIKLYALERPATARHVNRIYINGIVSNQSRPQIETLEIQESRK